MGRESEIVLHLQSDTALMALLTGGVYGYEATVRLGITRASTPQAFDADGFLLPLLVVKMRGPVNDLNLDDEVEQVTARRQVAELWVYEDSGYTTIEAVEAELLRVLQGHRLALAWPMRWAFTTAPQTDEGSLKGASVKRVDYQIVDLLKVAA